MADIERLGIRIEVDQSGASAAVVSFSNQFRSDTNSISRDLATIKSGSASASAATAQQLNNISVAINGVGQAAARNRGLVQGFVGGLAGGALVAITSQIRNMAGSITGAADSFALIEAKMRLATDGYGSFDTAMRDVVAISNDTRTRLADTAQLYSKVSAATKAMGLDQTKAAAVTTNFNKALKISGATTNEASSAILQFSQSLASGRLNGDEFRSLGENAPRFMNLLADSLNVPRGNLKKLASEGKITSDKLVKALSDPKFVQKLEKEFGTLPVTFADMTTAASNAMTRLVGAFAKGLGINDSLAVLLARFNQFTAEVGPKFQAFGVQVRDAFNAIQPTLQNLANVIGPILSTIGGNLGNIARLAIVAAAGFTVFKAATAAGTIATTVGQLVALERALGASSTMGALFSVAMKGVQGAVRGVTLALASNPITAIAVAVTVAAVALYEFSDQIKISSDGLGTLADYGNEILSRLGPMFTALGEIASKVFSAIGTFAEQYLGPIGKWWGELTEGMEFSFTGFVRFFAKALDLMINVVTVTVSTIASVFSNLPAMLQNYTAMAVNGATALFERFINGIISGLNTVSDYLGMGTIGNVNLGRVSASGQTIGKTFTQGIQRGLVGNPIEKFTDGLEAGANKRARDRARREAAEARRNKNKPSPNAGTPQAQPTAPETEDKDKKKKGETDKYAEEIKNLTNAKNDLARSERELAIAESLSRAGLERDPKLFGKKADAIRSLVNAVEDGKKIKTINEHIDELRRQMAGLNQSERDNAIAQELRSAGITKEIEDLAKLNPALAERIRLLKQEAGAKFDAVQKKEATKTEDQFKSRFADQAEDQEAVRLEMGGNQKAADELRINNELARTVASIREAKRENAQLDDAALIAQATTLANNEKQLAQQDRMNTAADRLSDKLVEAWENPREALRNFLRELIAGLIKAVLKATILNALMPGSGGTIGGNIKSMFGNLFGGGRATGGTVMGGRSYLVGERGPEIVRMGAAGRVFPNHRINNGGGGNVTLAPTYNIQMSGNHQQDQLTLAQIKSQQADQHRQIRSQQKVQGWQ